VHFNSASPPLYAHKIDARNFKEEFNYSQSSLLSISFWPVLFSLFRTVIYFLAWKEDEIKIKISNTKYRVHSPSFPPYQTDPPWGPKVRLRWFSTCYRHLFQGEYSPLLPPHAASAAAAAAAAAVGFNERKSLANIQLLYNSEAQTAANIYTDMYISYRVEYAHARYIRIYICVYVGILVGTQMHPVEVNRQKRLMSALPTRNVQCAICSVRYAFSAKAMMKFWYR